MEQPAGARTRTTGSKHKVQFAVLDVATGKETAWSPFVGPMLLMTKDADADDAGSIGPASKTIAWVPNKISSTGKPTGQGRQGRQLTHVIEQRGGGGLVNRSALMLQVAVGRRLQHLDLDKFIQSFEMDGAFSFRQLTHLSKERKDQIPALLKRWPYVIYVRDPHTGDTVLHFSAKVTHNGLRGWLTGPKKCMLLRNNMGHSALHEAAQSQNTKRLMGLVSNLDPELPLSRSNILVDDLVTIAQNVPSLLPEVFASLHGSYRAFRLICKRSTTISDNLTQLLDTLVVRASGDGLGVERWTKYEGEQNTPTATVKCKADLEVMALRGFHCWGEDGSEPPCTQIFHLMNDGPYERELDALLSTKVLQMAVDYKWSLVKGRVYWRMLMHMAYWLFITTTISISTQSKVPTSGWYGEGTGWYDWYASSIAGTTWSVPDVMMVAQAVLTTNYLMAEARQYQIARTKRDDWMDLWNWFDLTSIGACYITCAGHFTQSDQIESQVGSLAVLLTNFGFLQRLRPLTGTGPLIQTVLIIADAIKDFCIVLGVLMLGVQQRLCSVNA